MMLSERKSWRNGELIVSDELTIDFKWLGRQSGSELERAFYADIGIAVGDEWLTQLEDLEAQTVSDHLRGCAHRLAIWFAANWWRLRWEPETHDWAKNADWRIAHSVAAAGGGYVWPNVIFASDGESLAVASRPRTKAPAFELVRYLNRIDARITAAEFERKVDAFMDGVLSRLHAMGIEDDTLPKLWSEVLEERRDLDATRWRKLEALCGYDPDEAPAAMIERLKKDEDHLGIRALEEVAAYGRQKTDEVLAQIKPLADLKKPPGRAGIRGMLPDRSPTWRNLALGDRPWRRASVIAMKARQTWGLGSEPISNKKLAELLGTLDLAFTRAGEVRTQVPIAFRRGSDKDVDLFFHSLRSTGRRFAVGRLLGDHCSFAPAERLIPETEAKTARQQFQRAFAQEFLCPFEALRAMIRPDQPSDADFEKAADHFQVSPLLVKTTLVNHGELDRDVLVQAA
jgi:hypothetical protein